MENKDIVEATKPFNQHDACDDCGKRTDGLMTCTYSHDGSTTKLCPDCIKNSGFCLSCGNYSAGIESFDFSDMPGYCSECRDEIISDFDDSDDESTLDWACPNCGEEYDDIDYEYQICHYCKFNNQNK